MDTIIYFFEFVFRLDQHIRDLAQMAPLWVYGLFFMVIFIETGLVVMPFLPGDSFLFVIGTFAALNGVDIITANITLISAAILGDAVNYAIGQYVGIRAFNFPDSRWFNKKALIAAHNFYERHGGKAVILARFMPFVRTFVPFVAGIGTMPYRRFFVFNVVGAIAWVLIFTLAGYYFGQIEWVKQHFTKIALGIVIISVIPIIYAVYSKWRVHRKKTITETP